jgi:PhzF family phenazine biosynthesis protein
MELPIYQVDAFTSRLFEGNPAAVVPLEDWLPDTMLQAIAAENNLSETAFFVVEDSCCRLRWFTPTAEVDLCGHATLATAHVLFEHLGFVGREIRFGTRSGDLIVSREGARMSMDFPAIASEPVEMPKPLVLGLGRTPLAVRAAPDFLAIFEHEDDILALEPDFSLLARLDRRGVIATAPGREHDFVSRCFYPKVGVNEDPVTGSAHCKMTPYWAAELGKTDLTARQLSHRGGTVGCRLQADRVILTGQAVTYLTGRIRCRS